MLKRLAAVAALMVIPFAPINPVYAGPVAAAEDSEDEDVDADEPDEPETDPAPAGDVGTFGYSVGVDPRTWQFTNAFMIRHSPWGDWSEAILGLNTRGQVIEPNGQYAIESAGLSAHLGAKAWFLRLGVAAELAWVKRITMSNGRLNWQNAPGFLLEPYVGATLPFLQTPFTSLDARVYVPVTTFAPNLTFLTPDPAYGPRVMLNLWVGIPDMGGAGLGGDEEEGTTEDEGSTDEEEENLDEEQLEEEDEELENAPAPKPSATPAPKR